MVITHLRRAGHVLGFSGSSGPSQVTKFGSGTGVSGAAVCVESVVLLELGRDGGASLALLFSVLASS